MKSKFGLLIIACLLASIFLHGCDENKTVVTDPGKGSAPDDVKHPKK